MFGRKKKKGLDPEVILDVAEVATEVAVDCSDVDLSDGFDLDFDTDNIIVGIVVIVLGLFAYGFCKLFKKK